MRHKKVMSKRKQFSETELQCDSKTLRYELENMIGIAQQDSPNWEQTDRLRNNVYVEAFAVHCRALIFFLYGGHKLISLLLENPNHLHRCDPQT